MQSLAREVMTDKVEPRATPRSREARAALFHLPADARLCDSSRGRCSQAVSMNRETESDDLQKLRKAVLNEPRNAELRYLLAAEMAQAQDYEGAVLEFSAAIALNPTLHVARLQLGLLHLTLAQPHHTVAVLATLEDLPDDNALKYFKRGLEALAQDDFEPCIANMKRGIELNTSNPPLNRDMQLIVGKVQAAIGAAATPAPTLAPSNDAAPAVRTDFSLYNSDTKH